MELMAKDACMYLNVSLSTLTRWITDRDLPAHLVDGRYWVNRTELLEWAILNNVEVYPESVDLRTAK